MKGRLPAKIVVHVLKAESHRHKNEECYVKVSLGDKYLGYSTAPSATLEYDGSGYEFAVRDPNEKLKFSVRQHGSKTNYGIAKFNVTKIEHDSQPDWVPYPIYSGRDRKVLGRIWIKLWVSQWVDIR